MSEAPHSTLPYPPIHKDRKFVVLSDWDGTITNVDSNDYMTDNLGFGKEQRRQGNLDILSGKTTFRDGFKDMLDSIVANGHTLEYCIQQLVANMELDPGFKEFFAYCDANDIPFIIVSSGMEPVIRAVLSNLVGEEKANKIEIISNSVQDLGDGKWQIQYRHPSSGFGHDKSWSILPYRDLPNPPTTFFFGDGVSDMSAARHADVLFVKQKADGENDLAAYCNREGIKHILFRDFGKALNVVKGVVEGKTTPAEALGVGKC